MSRRGLCGRRSSSSSGASSCSGTREATYLAVYAAGVFVLLSMTSWAAVLRLVRHRRVRGTVSTRNLVAVVAAALFTTTATIVLFVERFTDGVWIYFVLVPLVAGTFDVIRRVRGDPGAPAERMGRLLARWQGDEVPALMTESLESDVPVEHVVERLRNGGATIEAPAGGGSRRSSISRRVARVAGDGG
ncbi:MAG: hypothetical protein M5T61_00395 [Acidimicrobiia bacterium]|nr:hypothetical protein [Acidimicrobiia bacterium]